MNERDILLRLQKPLKLSTAATLQRHPAGEVNHVFQLQDVHLNAAVKWLGEDSFSGVNRRSQFDLQQQLAALGVAPLPLWLSHDETLWVEAWVEDTPSTHSGEQSNQNKAEVSPATLASVLAYIHGVSVEAEPLNLVNRWRHYINVAQLPEGSELLKRAQGLEAQVIESEARPGDKVLCHNDLLKGHVLFARCQPPLLIDWEYAAMGNRYFDLASCCSINQLSEKESKTLVTGYANTLGINPDYAFAQYQTHLAIVHVTDSLWRCAMNRTH